MRARVRSCICVCASGNTWSM